MRIDGLQSALQQALLSSLAAKNGPFRPNGGGAASSAAPADGPAPPAINAVPHPATSVQMLVTLAAADPIAERRRKAVAQADRGLSLLEALHDELAAGLASPDRLRAMAGWAETFVLPDDPRLAELAREIELRVRVEIAKHDLIA